MSHGKHTVGGAKRVAIYARFSSDRQNERSTEDQFAVCRDRAAQHGFEVVRLYEDKAKSGASFFGRDGINDLLADAKHGAFEVVLAESLDRLSRDQEDIAHIHKRLRHAGIALITLSEGEVNELHIGLKGTMGAIYLKDLADKTRRGLSGVVRDGRHAGGKAFGYRAVPGKPGELEIVEHEAEIVREIFAQYVSGKTPRDIAKALNARNVLPPRGKFWTASTISGSRARRNGIILNDLYRGAIVWNRQSFAKDPDTGKRVSRANPQSDWQTCEAPHLRIVPDDLWNAAQANKAARGGPHPYTKRKTRYLLSGLIKCGCCGAGMTVHDTRNGRVRLRCARMYEAGACDNRRAYDMRVIEKLVIDALRFEFSKPEAMADFIKGYNANLKRRTADSSSRRAMIERQLAEAKASIARWLKLYADGHATDADMTEHIPAMREEVAKLEAKLATIEQPPTFIDLNPPAIAAYQAMLEHLPSIIVSGDADSGPAKPLRKLINTIVVKPPDEKHTMRLELRGKIFELITAAKLPGVTITQSSGMGDNVGCGGWI
ncbi:recombinase family protein [Hyphomicrobium sp. 2TAF46]|uniref:recombinase family protein n=1 Tax=Hyphomicrobium sp. 2TAF46 TaxID=3233019 RepID=UPI003F9065F3